MDLEKTGIRPENEQQLHDAAINKVAESRFAVEDWQLTLNIGHYSNSQPDIVASSDGQVVAVGEIETSATVSEQHAEQWVSFGEFCPRFYLFVPEGTESAAARLLDEYKIACAGLRCYSHSGDDVSVRSVPFRNGNCSADDHLWWQDLGKGQ